MSKKEKVEKKKEKVEKVEEQPAKEEKKNKSAAEAEQELRDKYQDKLIKDTRKDKRMGSLFWILLALSVGAVIFMLTTIIVRNA